MKCPKCNYISYDSPDRCRNCGFDLSMLVEEPPMRPEVADGALADLDLRPQAARPSADGSSSPDMPLFHEPGLDDPPLIQRPSAPRPPVAVRRSPEPARPRAGRSSVLTPPVAPVADGTWHTHGTSARTPDLAFDHDPLLGVDPAPAAAPIIVPPPGRAAARDSAVAATAGEGAAPGRRLAAGAIDLLLLAAINLAVVHFTLRLTGFDWDSVLQLRWAPMLGFFAVLNGGYFVAFTMAAGQTIGKMLASIRVVTSEGGRVPLATAIARAAAMLLSIASLGLGWAPAIVSRTLPTLHDRLAGTRVVDC